MNRGSQFVPPCAEKRNRVIASTTSANIIKNAETRMHRNRVTPNDQQREGDVVEPATRLKQNTKKKSALKIALFSACHLPIKCLRELSELLNFIFTHIRVKSEEIL